MKWTLVTGGAKNLGAAICVELARQGYSIAIHYKNSVDEAYQIAEECRKFQVDAEPIQGDFSTVKSTQKFINSYLKKFPETKNLINNVGNYFLGATLNTPIEQWCALFQTNLHAPFMLVQSLLPAMEKFKGSIINIGFAGMNASRADTYATSYALTKSALLTLTKSLSLELASKGMNVNMVSPGYLENAVDLPKDLTKIPMNRAAKNSEVAEVVAFLLSDKARYITGQNIEVAGGVKL